MARAAIGFTVLNNTRYMQQDYTITVSSVGTGAIYAVTEAGATSQIDVQVEALYEQLLGRDPDAAGLAFWAGSGAGGLGQMADSFLTSPENFNNDFAVMAAYQGTTGAPPTYAQFFNSRGDPYPDRRPVSLATLGYSDSLIRRSNFTAATLYQNLLNRPPAPDESSGAEAGLAAWFETLIGYPATTTPIGASENEFQSTGIYHTTLATDHTNALYLRMLYYLTLARDPDPGGFSFWLGIANGGGPGLLFQGAASFPTRIQIVGTGTPGVGFVGSPEFQRLFGN